MRKNILKLLMILPLAGMLVTGCKDDDDEMTPTPKDPNTAEEVSVDRFSADAGTLMVRDASNGLPAANAPIDYDSGEPFITKGLGPDGKTVEYYNFDVQPIDPAPIFVLFREGETDPVDGQLNIIDDIPGDSDYNDFWQVNKVTVPSDYIANVVTSLDEINAMGYDIAETDMLVNCPVVPKGSTASKRMGGGSKDLVKGWYRGKIVFYFTFKEKDLSASSGKVPVSPIFVTFNTNPPDGGPASGFVTEMGSNQTHNVVQTVPSDAAYSPLWTVSVYDNADFDMVSDLSSAQSANILATGVANVNCPIVSMQ